MSSKFTQRRFLMVLGAGTACLTLTGAEGCELLGRVTKLESLHTPRLSPLRVPKARLLPRVSPAPSNGVWSFRSRPDLSPPVVEVAKQTPNTAPGYILVAPEDTSTTATRLPSKLLPGRPLASLAASPSFPYRG
jgi:hypothetical protein